MRAVFSLLLAVLVSTIAVGPSAGASTAQAGVNISVNGDVSPEDVAITREGMRYAETYFQKTFGAGVNAPITVDLVYVTHPQGEHNSFENGYVITTDTWDFRGYSFLQRLRFTVHGYVHMWQHDLDQLPATPLQSQRGPAWLIEGSADFLAYQAVASSGIVSYDDLHEYVVRLANGLHAPAPPALPPLRDLANEQDLFAPGVGCCSYALGVLAVEQLTAKAGIGSLKTYFSALRSGAGWQAAFSGAFHQSPDDFYAAFEAARPALLTPSGRDISYLDITPPFNDQPAEIAVSSVSSPIHWNSQAILMASTAPGAHCTLTFISAKGRQLSSEPTFADSVGNIFWLWSVPNLIARGTAVVSVECGADPATVNVEIIAKAVLQLSAA